MGSSRLETLVLADNNLTELSSHIGPLKQLRMLDLGHNALTGVPPKLSALTSLTDFLYLHTTSSVPCPKRWPASLAYAT